MASTVALTCVGLVSVLGLACAGCSRNLGSDPAGMNMAPAQAAPAPSQLAQGAETVASSSYQEEENQAPAPPPQLPDYSQPECPGDNYEWTPGFWAYSAAGYYWTPGVWVEAPYVGALWTPPWWGYDNGRYLWHAGYWGPYVGFYGGIDYGFGYTGRGFSGGYWRGRQFFYNRAVSNIGMVRNVYDYPVRNFTPVHRVSYNGGQSGIAARATTSEVAAFRRRRMPAGHLQLEQQREAMNNRAQFASENHGRPAIAVARPEAPGARPWVEDETVERSGAPALNRASGQIPLQRVGVTRHAPRPNMPPLSMRPTIPAPAGRPPQEQTPRPSPFGGSPPATHAQPVARQQAAPPRPASEMRAAPPAPRSEPAVHAAPAPPRSPAPEMRAAPPAPRAEPVPRRDERGKR